MVDYSFVLITNIISMSFAWAVLVFSFVFYFKRRDSAVLSYIFIQFFIIGYMCIVAVLAYRNIILDRCDLFDVALSTRIHFILRTSLVFLVPFIFHMIFSTPKSRLRNIIFAIIVVLNSVLFFTPFFIDFESKTLLAGFFVHRAILYPSFIYSFAVIFIGLKKVENKRIIFVFKAFVVLLGIHFLFMICEDICSLSGYFIEVFVFGMAFNPLLYVVWNIFFLWFMAGYLSVKPIVINRKKIVGRIDLIEEYRITEREMEIILLTIDGYSKREIGEALFISELTVKTHIRNIYEKLGLSNRLELVKFVNEKFL